MNLCKDQLITPSCFTTPLNKSQRPFCSKGTDCLLWIDFAGNTPGYQEKLLQVRLRQFIILSLEVLTNPALRWHPQPPDGIQEQP